MLPQASQGTTQLQRILEVVLRALKRPDRRCTGRQRSCRLGLRLLLVSGQEECSGAANIQPMPQAWAPSPLTSPPRQSRPLQPLERGGRILQDEGQVPLFTGANAQQLAAMEQRAPLLYGSPDRHPHTESSSIPHDAIQAEVARQLDGLKQQLRAEQERAGRAEAEFLRVRSQQAGEVEATALQQVGTREVWL